MIEDHLEIFIFTYNRAPSLERTLQQFAAGPFRSCKISVLDNCSTDGTAQACARAKSTLPHLIAIRHPKNIGGLANYLRAIELAQAKYTWVICDDDSFDFSQCTDILQAIERAEADAISVGVTGHQLPAGAKMPLSDFALREDFFLSHSFIPSLIFKTSLFDPNCLRAGYDNIDTMFPHFPFLILLANSPGTILVSKNKIITKSNNVGYSTFRFLTGWVKSCAKIPTLPLRKKATAEVLGGSLLVKNLIYCVLTERAFRPGRYRAEYKDLLSQAFLLSTFLALKIALFSPLVLAPAAIHRMLWAKYKTYRARQGSPLPNFDEER